MSLSNAFILCTDAAIATGGMFQSATTRRIAWVIGIVVLAGVSWALYFVTDRRKKRRRANDSGTKERSVFDELCVRHGLKEMDRRLLKESAEQLSVAPASLFVSPTHLQSQFDRDNGDAYRALVNRLFPPSADEVETGEAVVV